MMAVDRDDTPQCLFTVMTMPSKVVEGCARTWGMGMGDVLQKAPAIAEAAFVANDTGTRHWRFLGSHAFHRGHKLIGKALDAVLVESSDGLARWNVIACCCETSFVRRLESIKAELATGVVRCRFDDEVIWIYTPKMTASVSDHFVSGFVKIRKLASAAHENYVPWEDILVNVATLTSDAQTKNRV